MTTQKPVAERLPFRVAALAAGALLIASLPLAAQNRSRPSDSSDTGRTARDAGSSPAHSAPSYSAPSEPSSSSASDPPRTAQPRGSGSSEPRRQPPSRGSRGDRDNDGGGRHHGRGGSGYYYPYGGGSYGFWPGFWGGWWGGYYPYYYPYGYEHGQPIYYGREGSGGALDLDVSPSRTEVYVDGQYLGKVDAFDGWPRYLWLPKGTYDLALYLDGYKTIARQLTVYPGTVIGIDDRLEPGDSVRPEDLASKSHDRRDDRLLYERDRSERIDRGTRGGDDEDWRDRVRRDRGSMRDHDDDDDDDADVEDVDVLDTTSPKGRLRLDIEPEDASVYLDGRFVGTGTDLALMRGGLPVSPGDHRLAVVRPGRKAEELRFEVKAGEDVELEIELDGDSGR